MSDNFETEIRKLAEKSRNGSTETESPHRSTVEIDRDFKAVLDELLRISEEGVKIYNRSVNDDRLVVYELPPDFLEIFLSIPGRRGGLSIVSPERIVVFFDEDPDVITVIGKLRSNSSGIQVNTNKSLQLIKISFSKTGMEYEYRDNTGRPLDPQDIIAVIMGWLVSS